MADEAAYLGPSAASESYLSIAKIIDAARRHGAEAIHPGYGFLSENAEFAEACETAGMVFIGPPAAAIRQMGSKTAARKLAIAAGAPVVPGSESAIEKAEDAKKTALRLGYPVLLKASAGGGGKGMRRVDREADLEAAIRDASSEALRAFQNGEVYLEKLVLEPRHIEIQVLGDRHGHMIHLGERECSIQRRHQKVIEECPSPVMAEHPELRQRMGEAALRIARAANYSNAGTIEFLVDRDRNFYFLEMNTRLQVEHPVTELVTGLDLVQWQLRIAAGEALTVRQEDVRWSGSAIECRIYAEDPEQQFLPSPGLITRLREAGRAGGAFGFGRLPGMDGAARLRSAACKARGLGAVARGGDCTVAAGDLSNTRLGASAPIAHFSARSWTTRRSAPERFRQRFSMSSWRGGSRSNPQWKWRRWRRSRLCSGEKHRLRRPRKSQPRNG